MPFSEFDTIWFFWNPKQLKINKSRQLVRKTQKDILFIRSFLLNIQTPFVYVYSKSHYLIILFAQK